MSSKFSLAGWLPLLLLLVGAAMVSVPLLSRYLYNRSLTPNVEPTVTQVATTTRPTHISIPRLLDVEIDPATYQNGHWETSDDNASHLASSANPGQAGNIIIYGHNQRQIMGNIRKLSGGEIVTLTLADGSSRQYRVETIHQVSPSRVEFLADTAKETLTLYTCAGFLDKDRFVVQAVPV